MCEYEVTMVETAAEYMSREPWRTKFDELRTWKFENDYHDSGHTSNMLGSTTRPVYEMSEVESSFRSS